MKLSKKEEPRFGKWVSEEISPQGCKMKMFTDKNPRSRRAKMKLNDLEAGIIGAIGLPLIFMAGVKANEIYHYLF